MDESKSKRKWPRVCLCLFLLLMLVAGLFLLRALKPDPGLKTSTTLPDGSKLTVMAVTYGTNHSLAGSLVRLVSHAPPILRGFLLNILGPRASTIQTMNSPTPELMVWLDAGTQKTFTLNWAYAALSDSNGFVSGSAEYPIPLMPPVTTIAFKSFPRRDRTLNLHLYRMVTSGHFEECGVLKLANPAYGRYPEWQPETLPVTRQAGDVEVTLKDFITGVGGTGMSFAYNSDGSYSIDLGTNKNDGRSGSACVIHLQSLSDTNQAWEVNKMELSDATGNVLPITGTSGNGNEIDFMSFEPALWSGEAAWKLRCGIKCVKGFSSNELISTGNVELGAMFQTNRPDWETNFNGVTIGFDQLIRRPPSTNNSWNTSQLFMASFKFKGMTNDLHFELVEARTDDGTKMENASGGSTVDGNGIELAKQYSFRNVPVDAKSINFTFALKKNRWVEFFVKPTLGSGHFEFPAQRKK